MFMTLKNYQEQMNIDHALEYHLNKTVGELRERHLPMASSFINTTEDGIKNLAISMIKENEESVKEWLSMETNKVFAIYKEESSLEGKVLIHEIKVQLTTSALCILEKEEDTFKVRTIYPVLPNWKVILHD